MKVFKHTMEVPKQECQPVLIESAFHIKEFVAFRNQGGKPTVWFTVFSDTPYGDSVRCVIALTGAELPTGAKHVGSDFFPHISGEAVVLHFFSLPMG